MLKCTELCCEYQENPIGLDVETPRFSWKLESNHKAVVQTAYEIIIENIWESGKVNSNQSILVPYTGSNLSPKTCYNYKVRVFDNYGESSLWSFGRFETGLKDSKWQAKWITPSDKMSTVPAIATTFKLKANIKSARIYASCYGIYEILLNNQRVSNSYFAPGFTAYQKRLQYQTYDVTNLLVQDENFIEMRIANGWCCGNFPAGFHNFYNIPKSALLQLEVKYLDNSVQLIYTDENWNSYATPIIFSELYDGECYDARCEYLTKKHFPVSVATFEYNNLVAQESEPVLIIDSIKPKQLIITPKGETVLDFGQNMVGWVEFRVKGNKGDKVCLRHAEVLDKEGNFYNANLRSAKQTTEYILSGNGKEIYHPHFCVQGFRYVKIEEFPKTPQLSDFIGKVVSSDIKQTGSFYCSLPLLNQLFENIIWGQRGNFIDIPTDCPQRDERLGWTGDAQVFMATALQNMNSALFFKKWLNDMQAEQRNDGMIPIMIPAMHANKTSSAWGDAATICPWEFYLAYADSDLLRKYYPSMKLWVEYIKNQGQNPYLWDSGFHYGDWLALDSPSGSFEGLTSHALIATAFYAHSCDILSKSAKILGYTEDADYYHSLFEKIKENFAIKFIDNDGLLKESTQTAYALTLKFNLTENKSKLCKHLANLIKANGNHLNTGFVGTPYLCNALAENGESAAAYSLLFQEDFPSWLYSVKKGATTIWEHWDGIKPDGNFWSPEMNSFNHYAYGSIGDFLYKHCAGINTDPTQAGYKKIIISPIIDSRLSYAGATINTPYGIVSSSWTLNDKLFKLHVVIPHNTSATIHLPDLSTYNVGSGEYDFSSYVGNGV